MSDKLLNRKLDSLFAEDAWAEAQSLLENALAEEPDSHWLLTQLGATLYERRRYAKALKVLWTSAKLVPDCPLTLWHLAGTLEALGKTAAAIRIYRWLLQSNETSDSDPCWESKEWSDSLKADCIYSLGKCFHDLGKEAAAEKCFRRFLGLLLMGIPSIYSAEDALKRVRGLKVRSKNGVAEKQLRDVIKATLRETESPNRSRTRNGKHLPEVSELLSQVASDARA